MPYLHHKSSLVVSFPYNCRVLLLCELGCVVVLVDKVDQHLSVTVELRSSGAISLSNDHQFHLRACFIIYAARVADSNNTRHCDFKCSVFISRSQTVTSSLSATIAPHSRHLKQYATIRKCIS